jgi:uncharacterized protein YneF (UPF0154 family)
MNNRRKTEDTIAGKVKVSKKRMKKIQKRKAGIRTEKRISKRLKPIPRAAKTKVRIVSISMGSNPSPKQYSDKYSRGVIIKNMTDPFKI